MMGLQKKSLTADWKFQLVSYAGQQYQESKKEGRKGALPRLAVRIPLDKRPMMLYSVKDGHLGKA